MAFSAYEFLNFVLPGALVIAVVFNSYTDRLITTESDVLELFIFAGASFLVGHLCAGMGSILFGRMEYPDTDSGLHLPTLMAHLKAGEAAPAPDGDVSSESSRKAAERLLELLGRDARSKMLGQQENLHRNLAVASLVATLGWFASETFGRNALPWATPVVLLALGGFFLHRFFRYRRSVIEHLELTISMLPTADRFSNLS
jgi:hypothetical protein